MIKLIHKVVNDNKMTDLIDSVHNMYETQRNHCCFHDAFILKLKNLTKLTRVRLQSVICVWIWIQMKNKETFQLVQIPPHSHIFISN